VKKLAAAPKGAVNFTLSTATADASASAATSSKAPAVEKSRRDKRRKAAVEEDSDAEASAEAEQLAEEDGNDEEPAEADAKANVAKEDGPLEDGFFSLEEMNKFADLAEAPGGMRLDEDAEDSDDFGMLEGGDEEDDDGEGKKATYADFFDPPSESQGGSKGTRASNTNEKDDRAARRAKAMDSLADDADDLADDDDEDEESIQIGNGGADDDEEELSDEERQLEEKLKKLQAEGGGSDDDQEEGEEESAAGDAKEPDDGDITGEEGEAKAEGGEASADTGSKSLYEMDKRLRALEDEVVKLEEEQLDEKHWSLRGEVNAKQRPLNSLLEVHLDQPMTQLAGSRAGEAADAAGAGDEDGEGVLDDVPGGDSAPKSVGFDVDAIIRQRVWDETYDDVVRRTDLPPSQRPHGADEDAVETLNFQKSRVGLGAIYEQQYETEMMGHKPDAEQREDKDKTETKELFAKLMYKLDLLTNAHFTPRPPTLGPGGEQLKKVASLKMEETIPLMMSDALLKAPEEVRAPRRHDRERNELTHEERKASRQAKKVGRRRGLEQRVEAGEITLSGMRERSAKLQEKNQDAKLDKAKQSQVVDAKKRLRSTDLLAQAAANASSGASRKDVAREERQKQQSSRPESSLSSKRLKL